MALFLVRFLVSRERLSKIYQALYRAYGPPPKPEGSPLEVLIRTVLSQNTNDRNRDLAYEALRRNFPDWESVLSAPLGELERCLHPAGLSRQRSKRIREILRKARKDFGEGELEGLCLLPRDRALEWLLNLPGVGLKTAYCVLAFGCGQDLFPVDTHILRITKRLGLLPERAGSEEAHRILGPMVPEGKGRDLHLLLIRYGREICRARNPRCDRCLFPEECLYRQKNGNQRTV